MFQCFGDRLWTTLEAQAGAFPEGMKLILKAAKCDDLFILAKWTDTDTEFVKSFMQSDFHELIKEEDKEKFYGIFKDNPYKFKWLAPDLKTIGRITNAAKIIHSTMKKSTSETSTNSPTNKEQQNKAKKPRTEPPQESSNDDESDKITKARDHLETNIKKWLCDNVRELATNEFTIGITSGDPLYARVSCPAESCTHVSEMKFRKGTTWAVSNHYKHIKTHIPTPTLKGMNIKKHFISDETKDKTDSTTKKRKNRSRSARRQILSSDEEDNAYEIDVQELEVLSEAEEIDRTQEHQQTVPEEDFAPKEGLNIVPNRSS